MKKLLLFLSVLTSISLTSCGGGGDTPASEKANLMYGYINDTPVIEKEELEIGYDTLRDMIGDKESFVLLLFHDRTCGCWKWELGPTAVQYTNMYNVKLYAFDNGLLEGKESFGLYTGTDVPGICFFEKGQLLRQTIYGRLNPSKRKMFQELEAFKSFVEENCYLPKMYYIEKEKLDAKISSQEDFNLYVARNGCTDCGAINEQYLDKWGETNKSLEAKKMLYIFDIQKYRGTPEYQNIKDTYGLSVAGNPTFGYDNGEDRGFIPTFQRIVKGEINDMITVLNDSADKKTGVVTSYFTEARISASPILSKARYQIIDGTTIDTSLVQPWGAVKQEKQLEWHLPAVELFFNTYVK